MDGAILKLADHFRATNETYYPDPSNYGSAVSVVIRRQGRTYEISEETIAERVAATSGVRYSNSVPASKAVSKIPHIQEAIPMPARVRKAPTKAKAKVVEPEPEELEELEEEAEIEDEELEDADDEVDVEEDEEDEEEAEEDEEDEEEDEEPEEESEQAEEAEEAKDYTPYAGKAPTPTMSDFTEWLLAEVFADGLPEGFDEDSFAEGVRLGGTLRMEFQRSDFCKDRREARKAEAAKPKPKPVKAAKEASAAKAAPAKKAPAAKATATKTKTAAAPARKTGAAAGRPAPRQADRPATKATTRRRGKAAAAATEEPF